MMEQRFKGKVALITGAARGQGRAEAIRLAQEGADVIAIDICEPLPTVTYEGAGEDDLAETVEAVEELGRRIVSFQADTRDMDGAAGLRRSRRGGARPPRRGRRQRRHLLLRVACGSSPRSSSAR